MSLMIITPLAISKGRMKKCHTTMKKVGSLVQPLHGKPLRPCWKYTGRRKNPPGSCSLPQKKIAWKTGTSYGHRDAWAIGITPKHVVGVWAGNADGEGRPKLTGILAAGPVLFDIFDLLPDASWFQRPNPELTQTTVCRLSGYKSSDYCTTVDTTWVYKEGLKSPLCPFHQWVHLDQTGKYRVTSDCEPVGNMQHKSWFVLPPLQAYYYKQRNSAYQTLPGFRKDCAAHVPDRFRPMQVIYPKKNTKIYVPKEIDGRPGKVVFEMAHSTPSTVVFWHLNNDYLGYTKRIHQMSFTPSKGTHRLTFVDENGYELLLDFEIISN